MATTYALPGAKPPDEVIEAFMAPVTVVAREAEIVDENDEVFLDREDPRVLDGSVTVDQTRAERRAFELELSNHDGLLEHSRDAIWYDKIVRLWRGVEYNQGNDKWLTPVGEFLIDSINSANFPPTIHIQGRDWMKQLLNAKFHQPTTFVKGVPVESLIKTIAQNGGIEKFKLVETDQITGKDWAFDSQADRATAIHDVAVNYGLECFFDQSGYLTLRAFQDPFAMAPRFTFAVGEDIGNLVTFSRSSNDTRLYNTVVVTGESSNTTPVYATAQNNNPASSTSVPAIGERTYFYTSSFITTTAQAQTVADALLTNVALEEYSMDLESICFPWLEAGDVVETDGLVVTDLEPTKFLLSSFSIPMALGSMSNTVKRVTKVL